MKHRRIAVLFAIAASALLMAPPAGAAQSQWTRRTGFIYPSSRECPNSAQKATMTIEQEWLERQAGPNAVQTKPGSRHTIGFRFDNPCSQWVMAIFLGAPSDAVFRFYAAPGAHLNWNAQQAQRAHIKDGANGNPIVIKPLHCAKQGRIELVVEANGRVHRNTICKK